MPPVRRLPLSVEARRVNAEAMARLGAEARVSRLRRRLTQKQLGAGVGLSRSTISLLERGGGGGLTVDGWQRIGLALNRPLIVQLARDTAEEPADAGHLAIQELLLRLARKWGAQRSFELPTRPQDPRRSIDVLVRDDRRRRLLILEAWNTIGDIGAAARSSSRKQAEAEALAVAIGGEAPAYGVHLCWVVRASARNRRLVGRYPEVFAARFPGSSLAWTTAIAAGAPPPDEPGLVWCDRDATRVLAWRRS